MTDYSITFARSARKEIERLDSAVIRRVLPRIEGLAKTPRPSGCTKLQGFRNLWRIRVGDYRVIYSVFEDKRVVDVVAIRHRSKAYE